MSNDDPNDQIDPYQKEPTLTVQQAALKMLGYAGPFEVDTGAEVFSVGLDEYCRNEVEAAEAAFSNATLDLHLLSKEPSKPSKKLKDAEEEVAKQEEALSKAKERCRQGEEFRGHINHEITKIRAGKRSLLVIDEEQTHASNEVHVTETSFNVWHEGIQDSHAEKMARKRRPEDPENAFEGGLRRADAESTYITMGALIRLLAKENPDLYGKLAEPNHSQISNAIKEYVEITNGKHPLSGQNKRAITKRLDIAIFHFAANMHPLE